MDLKSYLKEIEMANIMIQGTTSSAGKSLLCTGLCRYLRKMGIGYIPSNLKICHLNIINKRRI